MGILVCFRVCDWGGVYGNIIFFWCALFTLFSSFCPRGSARPTVCAAGSFSSTIGRSSLCNLCTVGQYSLNGSTECIPCDGGTFAAIVGSPKCLQCPIGKDFMLKISWHLFWCTIFQYIFRFVYRYVC